MELFHVAKPECNIISLECGRITDSSGGNRLEGNQTATRKLARRLLWQFGPKFRETYILYASLSGRGRRRSKFVLLQFQRELGVAPVGTPPAHPHTPGGWPSRAGRASQISWCSFGEGRRAGGIRTEQHQLGGVPRGCGLTAGGLQSFLGPAVPSRSPRCSSWSLPAPNYSPVPGRPAAVGMMPWGSWQVWQALQPLRPPTSSSAPVGCIYQLFLRGGVRYRFVIHHNYIPFGGM